MSKAKILREYKHHFQKYQKRFGLTHYRVWYGCVELDNNYANIIVNSSGSVASTEVNSIKADRPLRESAKHEAIHLLLGRFSNAAHDRFSPHAELVASEEEVVSRLEELIPY